MAKRINRKGKKAVLHYVTINIRDQVQLFKHDIYVRVALEQLRLHCNEHPAKLVAYVGMPEHMHVITNPRDGDINRFLSQFKPAVTDAIAQMAERLGHTRLLNWLMTAEGHHQLWQEGKHDLFLWNDWMIWQKINYIHDNPRRRRLVKRAGDYPYSSFAAVYDVPMAPIIPVDDWWWDDLPIDLEEEAY